MGLLSHVACFLPVSLAFALQRCNFAITAAKAKENLPIKMRAGQASKDTCSSDCDGEFLDSVAYTRRRVLRYNWKLIAFESLL